jgi:hypothetical protein
LATDASDAPCRAPRVPGRNPGPFSENQNRFPRPRVNENGFHGPERLSSTSALLERNPLSRNPFVFGLRARHRSPGLATEIRLPALLRYPMLSHWTARPTDGSAGSSPAGAMGRAPLVDFCNRIRSASMTEHESPEPRAPHRQSPTCAALPADGYAESGRRASLSVAVAGARPVESSRVRDRGSGAFAPQSLGTSPSRSLARGALPQPDRPGHLLSQARDAAGWSNP